MQNFDLYIKDKLDEIREELPEDEYLYIFNVAPQDIEGKVKERLQLIQIAIRQILELQDDCYSI